MKRTLIVVTMLVIGLVEAFGQLTPLDSWKTKPGAYVGRTRDTLVITSKNFQASTPGVFNHSYTDTLKLFKDSDTTNLALIYPRGSYKSDPTYAKFLVIWSTGDSTHYEYSATGEFTVPTVLGSAGGIDSAKAVLDRIEAKLPAAKPARFTSVIRNGYNATPTAVGDIWSDSTGTAFFDNAVLTPGGSARALMLITKVDTLITASFLYRFYSDSIPLIANNAPNVLTSANLAKYLGEAVVSVKSGQAGSTASYGQVMLYGGLALKAAGRRIFYTMECLTAFTPKKAQETTSELVLIYD